MALVGYFVTETLMETMQKQLWWEKVHVVVVVWIVLGVVSPVGLTQVDVVGVVAAQPAVEILGLPVVVVEEV